MRKSFLALLFVALCSVLTAQQALSNDSVIKLVKAGLSEDLIVSTISASPGAYDTSATGLIALKSAGVSDKVVTAIVMKGTGAVAATPAAAADPNDPNAPHEAGIYAYSVLTGKPVMTQLEPSVYGQGKTSGVFATAMTYGIAKAKIKAVIRGPHSNARLNDPKTVFYFFFENETAGLSQANNPFNGTSTPNEYTLLRFETTANTRETTIGKISAWGGSTGNDDKATQNFTYEKIRPGVYKVTLKADLAPGEYGFVAPNGAAGASAFGATTGSSGRVFDFGHD